jgi:hypothetical protein
MPGQALPKEVTWLGAFVLSPAYLISGCSRSHFSARASGLRGVGPSQSQCTNAPPPGHIKLSDIRRVKC